MQVTPPRNDISPPGEALTSFLTSLVLIKCTVKHHGPHKSSQTIPSQNPHNKKTHPASASHNMAKQPVQRYWLDHTNRPTTSPTSTTTTAPATERRIPMVELGSSICVGWWFKYQQQCRTKRLLRGRADPRTATNGAD